MKKIIALLLCFVLFVPNSVFAANDSVPADELEILLTDLGVLEHDNPEEIIITRAYFAKALAILSGIDKAVFEKESPYADVSSDYEYNAEIAVIKSLGVAVNTQNNHFCPNDNLKYTDAVKMLVRFLGYGSVCHQMGGEIAVAGKTGITVKVSVPVTGLVSYDVFAQLMKNIINKPVMIENANGKFETDKEKTVLTEYLDIITFEGRVTENGYTSLSGETFLPDNKLVVENDNETITLTSDKTKDELFDYLGYEVTAYYRDDGLRKNLILITKTNTDGTLVISSASLNREKTSKNTISYYDKSGSLKSKSIAKDAKVIYNKKALRDYTDDDFRINDGSIILISSSGSKYDVVIINEYTYTLVSGVSESQNSIFDRYNTNNVVMEDKTDIFYNDTIIPITALEFNDLVISQKAKSGEVVSVRKVLNRAVGVVNQISPDDIVVDDVCYEFSQFYSNIKAMSTDKNSGQPQRPASFYDAKLGATVCMLLDDDGLVAAIIEVGASQSAEYGYLIQAGKNTNSLTDIAQLRMLTSGGDVKTLNIKEKCVIDGASVKASNVISQLAQTYEKTINDIVDIGAVVTYRLNDDGYVSHIDTEYVNPQKESENNSLTLDIPISKLKWSMETSGFEGKALFNSTVLFAVPDEISSRNESYGIMPTDALISGEAYDFAIYDIARNGVAGAAYVIADAEAPGAIPTWADIYMVEEKRNALNSEGDESTKLLLIGRDGKKSVFCKDDIGKDIKRGEVIRIGQNPKGEVNSIEHLLKTSGYKTPFKSSENFTTSYWFYYGKVNYYEGNTVSVSLAADDSDTRFFNLSLALGRGHYTYDCDTDEISVMKMSDLVGAENSSNPSYIFMYAWKGEVREIFVINNVGAD